MHLQTLVRKKYTDNTISSACRCATIGKMATEFYEPRGILIPLEPFDVCRKGEDMDHALLHDLPDYFSISVLRCQALFEKCFKFSVFGTICPLRRGTRNRGGKPIRYLRDFRIANGG